MRWRALPGEALSTMPFMSLFVVSSQCARVQPVMGETDQSRGVTRWSFFIVRSLHSERIVVRERPAPPRLEAADEHLARGAHAFRGHVHVEHDGLRVGD